MVPIQGRAGKNATFQRMVPLHPAVIAEGFLSYLADLPNKPDGPLFPDLTAGKDGSRTIAATSALGRWVRTTAKVTREGTAPAHSWRHRMEDELRRIRALPEVVDAITGRHNPRNAGAGYGMGFRGMPDETLKELRRVPVPGRLIPTDASEDGVRFCNPSQN
jgi:integrase